MGKNIIEKPFDENETVERLKAFYVRNPVTSRIFLILFCGIFILVGFQMLHDWVSPPPPVNSGPGYTLGEAFDHFLNLKLPFMSWVLIFVLLWLTKW